MAKRVNNFDLIRLFGAAQVAVSHSIVHLHADSLLPIYQTVAYLPGVAIFFAISGYLVSLSWERAPSWEEYATNRALRIFPALWTALALSVFILYICGVKPDSAKQFVVWIGAQLTIGQFYNPSFIRGFGVGVINGAAWTIPVEMQFYVLLPFLALIAKRNAERWWVLTALAFVLTIATRALILGDSFAGKIMIVTILPWLSFFLMGVSLRYVHARWPQLLDGRALIWAIAYAAWVAIEIRFNLPGANKTELNVVGVILLSGLTISTAFTAPTLASKLLRDNDISYGTYIYHMPFVNLLLFLGLTGVRGVALALTLALSFAALSWRLIEKPALSLKGYSIHFRSRPIQRHSILSE